MSRISLVHQGSASAVEIHQTGEDESIFDEYDNCFLRVFHEENADIFRLINFSGTELLLSREEFRRWIINLSDLADDTG